jgi:hypothetical protein
MDPQNIFVMFPPTHAEIHGAFGGTQGMNWGGIRGNEASIQDMFNFWINSPKPR